MLDSSTMIRVSLKTYFAVAEKEGFGLRSIGIRAALLQTKGLNREVFFSFLKINKLKNLTKRMDVV